MILVISGPSGVGKGTIVKKLCSGEEPFHVVTSYTTRLPKVGERDGVEYHFVTREEFLARVEAKLFIEWKEYGGNLYGTPVEEFSLYRDSDRNVILEIEVEGALSVMEQFPDAFSVFVYPPSKDELYSRIARRGRGESAQEIERRLEIAALEIEKMGRFHTCVKNDDLGRAVEEIEMLFLQRKHRRSIPLLERREIPAVLGF